MNLRRRLQAHGQRNALATANLLYILATVGVIAIAGIGVSIINAQNSGGHGSGIASSLSSSQQCNNAIPAGTMWSVNSTESTKLAFFMNDNSVATLCVTYTTDPSFLTSASLKNFTEPLSGSVVSVHSTYESGVGWQYSTHPVPGLW